MLRFGHIPWGVLLREADARCNPHLASLYFPEFLIPRGKSVKKDVAAVKSSEWQEWHSGLNVGSGIHAKTTALAG